ncbi:antitoxin VbhA family protein [Pseudomonas tremae]|uniref:antitoxin VbhA family protein n=1 Tax=Pseudomonas tremae TaxID=200454 RepID=UPI00210A1C3D|nr:antitoxin VbhA family protein [Pseudomonas tremae]MCQ2992440.1 antitoxin VbhA family protein [Pseudomonas tremae]
MVDQPTFIESAPAEPLPIFVTKQRSDRAERLRAVNYARASVGLEGFKLSALDEERARAYVEGEISLDEFLVRSIPSA